VVTSTKKENILEYLSQHWVVISTSILLFSTALGFLFSKVYFGMFSVEFLHFAELPDLVSLLLINYSFFLSAIPILGLFWFAHKAGNISSSHPSDEEVVVKLSWKERVAAFFLMIILLLIVALPFIVTTGKANAIKSGNVKYYSLVYGKPEHKLQCVNLVGSTTSNYIFWERSKTEAVIIPKNQVVEIRVVVPEPPKGSRNEHPARYFERLDKWEIILKKQCGV